MRAEKKLLLEEIKEKIKVSQGWIATRYENFTPQLSWSLSSKLIPTKSEFEVVRKRIFIKAAKECGVKLELADLPGHIGVVFIQGDPLVATKEVYNFKEQNEKLFIILLGQFEEGLHSAKDLDILAKLPTQEEMRSQFLATLETPASQTLAIMENVLLSILHCLEAKK